MSLSRYVVHIHPTYEKFREELLDCIKHFDNKGDILYAGSRNKIKRIALGKEFISIKAFKAPHCINSFVYKFLRKSKAKRSFLYAEKLIDSGISTPQPVAYIENFSPWGLQDSYYICVCIDYDFDFRTLIHNPTFPDRVQILNTFTNFTFKLHEAGVHFLDHSPGNTLIVKDEDQYTCYLIDLNRMRFEQMDFETRMSNFRRLWLSKGMIQIMAKTYAELYQKPYKDVHGLMTKYSRKFQRKINRKKLRKAKRSIRFKRN